VAVEFGDLPFAPRRQFFVHGVSGEKVRGEHAHRHCRQLLIALHGSLHVILNDGKAVQEIRLDTPGRGLLLEPMTWSVQYKFSRDAVLGVYASLPYDPDDYIRDFDDFKRLLGR
jgi:hypothetical protein